MFDAPDLVLQAARTGFGARRILVVGDLMLDRYLWGRVDRISPEAPIPVVHLQRKSQTAGGAANVARNLTALGLQVDLAGVTGDDQARCELLADLARSGIDSATVLIAPERETTVKTRVVGNHQQLIRIDEEHTSPLSAADRRRLELGVRERLPGAAALILSDYAKGVLDPELCAALIGAARAEQVPVLVDPKGRDYARYSGATLITPNRSELALVTGAPSGDLDGLLAAGRALREALAIELLVVTLSELGMALIGPDAERRLPAVAREVFDVSGAGDTVIATLAAGLAAGLGHTDSAHLANLAAGVVVGKIGTAPISSAELTAAITGEAALEQAAKVQPAESAAALVRRWQAAGERVVFANGCFDLLHVGHVTYLERARRYGHRLVVGLNTDRSVRALKGPDRPVIRENDRARVLAALASVDAVVLFDEDTPLELIRRLRPDVLAKGADYRAEEVVGAADVRSWGGELILVPLVEDRSTSAIIRQLGSDSMAEPPSAV